MYVYSVCGQADETSSLDQGMGDTGNIQEHRNISNAEFNAIVRSAVALAETSVEEMTGPHQSLAPHPGPLPPTVSHVNKRAFNGAKCMAVAERRTCSIGKELMGRLGSMKGKTALPNPSTDGIVANQLGLSISVKSTAAPLGSRTVNVAARSFEGDYGDSAAGAAELHSVVGLHARGYVKDRPGLPQKGYGGSGGSHNQSLRPETYSNN
ncbi:hypothetical protein M427DRAFT_46324 [Gonapodya prolifera JEL478]|uniref:Uncharacterized protein n=1 Tax=Gonapodya prolifera (strain JEL478) TaxID=1344416 RepID=A0A139A6U1_GONPJ|nr:hypothetical protein M427DRAFT_46324 [Gonapodya prolifera JEL478]|eukprot:KXS12379.1 hypothetical protein M427DRAFT_46324 [Gonapodya prolifera JEL478]